MKLSPRLIAAFVAGTVAAFSANAQTAAPAQGTAQAQSAQAPQPINNLTAKKFKARATFAIGRIDLLIQSIRGLSISRDDEARFIETEYGKDLVKFQGRLAKILDEAPVIRQTVTEPDALDLFDAFVAGARGLCEGVPLEKTIHDVVEKGAALGIALK